MLNLIFSKLISKFSNEENLKANYWQEIEKNTPRKAENITTCFILRI